jgi:hypothetical protein
MAWLLPEFEFCTTRGAFPAVIASSTGTRTPAPQRLHRIFWPAKAGLVANFRPQDGHANRNETSDSVSPPTVSNGAGIVTALRQPPQLTCWPIWDQPAWFSCPQKKQLNRKSMPDLTSRDVAHTRALRRVIRQI